MGTWTRLIRARVDVDEFLTEDNGVVQPLGALLLHL